MTEGASPFHPFAPVAADRPVGGPRHETTPWYSWAMVAAFEAAMLATLPLLVGGGRWPALTLTLVVMATVLSPAAARRWAPVRLPVPLEMGLVAFLFGSLFLGEIWDFYNLFHWWDVALHGSSGVLFSLVGILLAYCLERQHGHTELAPRVAFLFAPMFAMSIGTVWEIFEFSLQYLSGLPIQVPQMSDWAGLSDTMWDMIVNAIGAILVAIYGWRRFRPGSANSVPVWVARFMAENPRFLVRDG
jgi:hypothetical protein